MKKLSVFLALCFSLFVFTACGELSFKENSCSKIIFENIGMPAEINYECLSNLIEKAGSYKIIVVRDDNADFGTVENNGGTIDENLRLHREKVKKHYSEKNNAFIKKFKLKKLSDYVYPSDYTPFIVIGFEENKLSKKTFNTIIKLANSDEVATIYISKNSVMEY